MAFYSPRERHIADLHEAFRTESIDRRNFLKVAGAAAVAGGLSHKAAVPAPASVRRVVAQPEANVFVYGSPQDISNLDPHTGHDYSIATAQKAVYDGLMRYEGNPAELKTLLATEVVGSPDAVLAAVCRLVPREKKTPTVDDLLGQYARDSAAGRR